MGVAILAAIAAYLPALRNGFVWDDPIVLQQLRAIQSWHDLIVMPPIVPKFYYRPLVFLTYLFDRALGGETPYWFHASVVAMHALNTWLVAMLARRLFTDDWLVPACAALLFAVHPVHTESVAWMAGRSDVLVCALLLATLLLASNRGNSWTAALAGLMYFLALLSKEMAVAALLLVPLFDVLETRRAHVLRYVPLLMATLVYFLLRQRSVGAWVGGSETGIPALPLLRDLLCAIGVYVFQILVPVSLSPYVPAVPNDLPYLLAGILGPLAALSAAWWAWRERRWEIVFLIAWFFVALAPSLLVIVRRSASAVIADRYLYVPSVATCILLAWVLIQVMRRWQLAWPWPAGVVAAIALIFAAQTQSYARVWTDNLSFWSDVVNKVPDAAMPRRELGVAQMEQGQLAAAEQSLRLALDLPSDGESRVMAYSNLGSLYRRQGRVADAEQAFEAALKIAPHPGLYHNLGMTLMTATEQAQKRGDQTAVLRDIVRAREAFERALVFEHAPNNAVYLTQWEPAKSHALLGQVLFSLGERDKGREHLEMSLRLQPSGPVADTTRRYLKQFGGS